MLVMNSSNDFGKRLKRYLNTELHMKVVHDENPALYMLREIGNDHLVVDYGESQRIIPFHKIIFVQIGDYPKE